VGTKISNKISPVAPNNTILVIDISTSYPSNIVCLVTPIPDDESTDAASPIVCAYLAWLDVNLQETIRD
jgi:hypothetical protein